MKTTSSNSNNNSNTPHPKNTLYISCSDKGGVGKSEICLLAITAMDRADIDFEYGEIDEVRKLSLVLGEKKPPAVSLKTSPKMDDKMRSQEDYIEFFNPVAELFMHPVSVLDLGGGVSTKFMEWAKASDLPEVIQDLDVRPVFMAIATPDALSFMSAVSTLRANNLLFRQSADYVLVLNDISGAGFQVITESPSMSKEIKNLQETMGVRIIHIPHLPSNKVMTYARAYHLSAYEAWGIGTEVLNALRLGEDFTRNNSLNAFVDGVGATSKSRPEMRLFLSQQMKSIGTWITEAQASIYDGLNLSRHKLVSPRSRHPVEDSNG